MTAPSRIPPLLRLPPPFIFLATFLVGFGVDHWIPLPRPPSSFLPAIRLMSWGLVGIALLLSLSCVGIFFGSRTTVIPSGTASKLVTRGPYRFTRNPMYLSLVLAYLGAAGLVGMIWPVLLLPLPVILVHTIVIPFEEARLRQAFGASFDEYRVRVRRWI